MKHIIPDDDDPQISFQWIYLRKLNCCATGKMSMQGLAYLVEFGYLNKKSVWALKLLFTLLPFPRLVTLVSFYLHYDNTYVQFVQYKFLKNLIYIWLYIFFRQVQKFCKNNCRDWRDDNNTNLKRNREKFSFLSFFKGGEVFSTLMNGLSVKKVGHLSYPV